MDIITESSQYHNTKYTIQAALQQGNLTSDKLWNRTKVILCLVVVVVCVVYCELFVFQPYKKQTRVVRPSARSRMILEASSGVHFSLHRR